MPEKTRGIADIEPARLEIGVAVPVPESDLVATLDDYEYARALLDDGTETVVKWAQVRFAAPGHEEVSAEYPLDQTYRIHGQRCYITGSRSEVLVFALPELPDHTGDRKHVPL